MISFKIPEDKLRLFLVALNVNFKLFEADYIFQVKDGFEVVYIEKSGTPMWQKKLFRETCKEVDAFVEKMWASTPSESDGRPIAIQDFTIEHALRKMLDAYDVGQESGPNGAIGFARRVLANKKG